LPADLPAFPECCAIAPLLEDQNGLSARIREYLQTAEDSAPSEFLAMLSS